MNKTETISITSGKEYIFDLVGKGTAGYSWIYKIDNENIVSVSSEYIVPEDHKPGGEGIERFSIKGKSKGVCTVEFSQVRSWEKDLKPFAVRTYIFKVE